MSKWIARVAFGGLSALWLAFGAALVLNPRLLDALWGAFRDLPFPLQALVGLLALPVVAGLWVWEADWPTWVRGMLLAMLAIGTVYTFFPRPAAQVREEQ